MKKIDDVFDENELIKLALNLIEIDSSTACAARERNVAAFLMNLFKHEGIPCRLQEIDGDRGNVIALLTGNGTKKSLMLNGHMDTVPAGDMQQPFAPYIKNGILRGRGAADMKSGLAAMAYSLILLKRMEILLGGDVVFAGVIDEEAAKSTGSRYLAEYGPKTDYAIVGEPTCLRPVTAHKGIDYFSVTFTGRAAHSSTPENGINAVYAASEYALLVKDRLIPEYQKKCHPLVGSPTVNLGLVKGAAQANTGFLTGHAETFAGIVPDICTVWLDIRWIPGQTIEGILSDLNQLGEPLKDKYPGLQIHAEYIRLPRPAMEIAPDDDLVIAVARHAESFEPGAGTPEGASYFADSGILSGVGHTPSMIFGPGDIRFAHAADEHIETGQIIKAAKIYALTAAEICGLSL